MTRLTSRFAGIRRDYTPNDIAKLQGSVVVEHTLARLGAERLWQLLHERPFVPALGALTGNQALQQVKAGLEAIYLSGWQVAADANNAGEMYPDQSLYPVSSVPDVVRRINKTFTRADQIARLDGDSTTHWFAPIVADAEAVFGWLAQCLRADEGDDRGGRRRRPLRGPARFGEEVRSSRRQGSGADPGLHPHAQRGASGGRRLQCAHRADRAHRRPFGDADHQRFRRARHAVAVGGAHGGGLLPPEAGRRSLGRARHRAQPELCPLCRRAVVGDLHPRSRRGARVRRRDSPASSGQALGL